MVIGGLGRRSAVDLASLDPDSAPVPSCLNSLSYLPVGRYAAAGAVDEHGHPFVCGGRIRGAP